MKTIFLLLVPATMLIFSLWYSLQIYRKKVQPALSTWVIFLIGTILSLSTYLFATDFNISGGILNLSDIMVNIVVIISTIKWAKLKMGIRPFEKWYLFVSCLIAVFWFITQQAFLSNLLIQIIMFVGYLPTLQKFLVEKNNTESYTAWGLALLASIFSIDSAINGGSILSLIYVGRSIVMMSLFLIIMYRLDHRTKQ